MILYSSPSVAVVPVVVDASPSVSTVDTRVLAVISEPIVVVDASPSVSTVDTRVLAVVPDSVVVVDVSPSVAVVPGLIVVPPAALICWLSARISHTRAFNSSVFAEINIVCVVTTASALSLAAFFASKSSDKSEEEHHSVNSDRSRLVRIDTMVVAFAGS